MKKLICLVLALLMLAGCGAAVTEITQPPQETVPEFTGEVPVETESAVAYGGVFGLFLNGDEIAVDLPEEFAGQLMDQSCLGACSEDQLSFLTYTLSDADVEDLRLAIEQEAFNAREGSLYKSHGEGEQINGFTTMYLIYSDSMYTYYAWKELENSTLFLCAELEGMDLELAELIAGVQIVED